MSRIAPPIHRPSRVLARLAILATASLWACTPAHLPGDEDKPQGICGDGRVNGDETCDDGNSNAGDGCSDVCQPEIPPNCGDGVLVPEEGEECDDGNMESGDGCGFGCWIEGCGNGFLDPGEACEDGNNVEGDGCSVDCKSDESCGNGIIDAVTGEICDDGNGNDTDLCPASCEPARCGDGFIRKGIESCDDGNDVDDDGCTDCILDSCGNAELDSGEECDQGAANGSDGSSCFRTCLTTEVEMELSQSVPISIIGNFSAAGKADMVDINGDGRLDAVISSRDDGTIASMLGKGDGTVARTNSVTSLFSSGQSSLLADVNGDGMADLIIVGSNNLVTVLLAAGDEFVFHGSFATTIDVGGLSPRDLVVAELTGDSFVDVATANASSNDVTILAGDGTGNFVAAARFGTQSGNGGQSPTEIAVGDVTGDGKLDLVTAQGTTSDVAVLAGLGGGAFAAPEIYSTVLGAQGTTPIDLVLAEVTNDGKLDVLTANSSSSDVTVLAQLANGTLATPLAFPTFRGDEGLSPRALAVGDINKDGVPDIVTANVSDVSIIPGLGAGVAFGPPVILTALPDGETTNLTSVGLADLNGDSNLDVVVANSSGIRDLRVFLGDGTLNLKRRIGYQLDAEGSNVAATSFHFRDVDGDGKLDVIAVGSNQAVVVPGDGDGRLLSSQLAFAGVSTVGIGDLNGDNRPDYVAGVSTTTLFVGVQAANGRFAAGSASSPSSVSTTAMVSGDFDGNGTIDVAGIAGSALTLLSGGGTGGFSFFSPSTVSLTSTGGLNIIAVDVSGDGDLDLLTTVPSRNEVNVLFGNGAGGFTNPTLLPTVVGSSGQGPQRVIVADIDGQMGGDVITANPSTRDFSVIRSTGSGTFAAAKIVPAVFGAEPADVVDVAAGDVNGDGLIDLVSANRARSTISVVLGFGNGNFAAPQVFTAASPGAVAVGDFDGDGLDDVLVGSAANLVIFLGKGHP